MDTLKILIVEDDFLIAFRLENDLKNMGYKVIGPVANSKDAIASFREEKPGLVLMDIDLKGSALDGIEIAAVFNQERTVPIIFLSALGGEETVNRAKSVNPSYYLIKPCNTKQLQIAIDFAIRNFVQKQEADVEHSLQYNEPLTRVLFGTEDMFFIKRENKYTRINIANIVYVKAESPGNNIRIVTDFSDEISPTGLKFFTEQIKHAHLLRVNRSYIININKIISFDGRTVSLIRQSQQITIPIGGTYRSQFEACFLKLRTE